MPSKFVPKPKVYKSARKTNNSDVSAVVLKEYKPVKKYIEELDILDYKGRRNPKAYDEAAQKLETYITTSYGWNGHIFNHLADYEFAELDEVDDDDFTPENDPNGFAKASHLEDLKDRKKKINKYNDNKPKVYAIIWSQCTNAMQHKIREDENFGDFDATKDPLRLWGRIQEILLTGAGQFQNQIKVRLEAKRDFDRMRQYKNESVGDFYQRYLVEQQALTASEIELPDDEEQAMDFINKLDVLRFASLLADLDNATQAGRDEYPKSVSEAMTRAINYKVVVNRYNGGEINSAVVYTAERVQEEKNKTLKKTDNKKFIKDSQVEKKKTKNEAPINKKKVVAVPQKKVFPKKTVICWLCKEEGHYKNECPNLVENEADEQANVVYTLLDDAVLVHSKIAPYDVLADNQATVSIFGQKDLLKNIRKSQNKITIQGIGGKVVTDLVGDFDFFGEVYYSPSATANVLSFSDLQNKFIARYDRDSNSFKFTLPNGRDISFEEKNKLYVYDASDRSDDFDDIVLVETVAENEMLYTKRQVQDAKSAKTMMQRLGYPSVSDLSKMISNGSILDCPVTLADLKRATEIYGPDLASLKGKTVSKKSNIAKIEFLPRSMIADITLCMDIIFVNSIPFLVSISEDLGLLMVQYITDRSKESIKKALDSMIKIYKSENFDVRTIKCDGEGGVAALEPHINGLGIKLNPTGKGQHVPQIERKARQIKERVRAHISILPFKLTKQLIVSLVQFCVQSINLMPQSTREIKISPKELFTGRKINYARDLKITFGEYAQIHEDDSAVLKNSTKERTADAIALRMKGNVQGTAEFYSLTTWKVVSRDQWTILPMPPAIIEKINKKAESEKLNKTNQDFSVTINEGKISINEETSSKKHDTEKDNTVIYPENNLRIMPNNISEPIISEKTNENDLVVDINDAIIDADTQLNEDILVDDSIVEVENESQVLPDYRGDLENNAVSEIIEKENTISENEQRYNFRSNRAQPGRWANAHQNEEIVALHVSIQQSVKDLGPIALKSISKELKQMIDKKVWKPVKYSDLSPEQVKKIIRSRMFIKKKSDGVIKARLVAGGHMQDKTIYENLASPTVSTQSVLMVAAIAASEKRKVCTCDIVGAYLHASMEEQEVYMEIDNYLSEILIIMYPEYKPFLGKNGKICVLLMQALYGCVESAHLFYLHLSKSLLSIGFSKNPYDDCVFNNMVDGYQCTIAAHVDDLLITCVSQNVLEKTISDLKKIYQEIKFNFGDSHVYLGMNFIFSEDQVELNMIRMIEEIVEKYLPNGGISSSPASNNLFDIDESSPLLDTETKNVFHTITAKLLYLSKRARPDILTAIAYLTTRVLSPNVSDNHKLFKVIKYLNGSKNIVMKLSFDTGIFIQASIDASHGVHHDFKGHTGCTISIGGGTVFASSSKQKLNSKSSFEAELIGLSDRLPQVIWTRYWLQSQGYKVNPAKVYQDNMSTIAVIKKGKSTSMNSRHVNIRYFFAKDRADNKEIEIEYKKTDEMVADILTKPLQGKKFLELRKTLMNLI